MTKNCNTFARFQEQRQTQRSEIIGRYLENLKGKGILFPHITALAELVAKHVAGEEHRACDKATLLRNAKYRSLLSNFLYSKKFGIQNTDFSKVSDGTVQAIVATSKLEVANLRRENERLKIYIAALERESKPVSGTEVVSQNELLEATQLSAESAQIKYATVCQALHSMLVYMKNMVSADVDAEQFVDLSKMRNNVIVERRLAAPFFEWLRMTERVL